MPTDDTTSRTAVLSRANYRSETGRGVRPSRLRPGPPRPRDQLSPSTAFDASGSTTAATPPRLATPQVERIGEGRHRRPRPRQPCVHHDRLPSGPLRHASVPQQRAATTRSATEPVLRPDVKPYATRFCHQPINVSEFSRTSSVKRRISRDRIDGGASIGSPLSSRMRSVTFG